MPLTADLEALVKELEKVDPAAAKAQRELLEKHEVLQKPLGEHVMRQNDYDRKLNENKKKIEEADQWKGWAARNMPLHEQLVKDHADLEQKYRQSESEKAELEIKVKAAAAASTGEAGAIDPGKLQSLVEAEIGKRGYVSKAEADQIIKDQTTKMVEEGKKEFLDKTFPLTALWITHMLDAKLQHRDEFGKPLDEKVFSAFLKDNSISDPLVGYERFVADQRTQRKIDDEVKKQVTAREDELKKQYGGHEFPGTSGGPQPMGALQLRLGKRDEADPLIPKDAELGDGSLALAAAAEMRAGK